METAIQPKTLMYFMLPLSQDFGYKPLPGKVFRPLRQLAD
jgi:hypothetical protein